VCWKSEDKIEEGSAEPFIERLKNFKHESVLEHGSITVRFICDRGVSHELVRHRLASFSQESTRYCNYSKGKFNHEVCFVEPTSPLTAEQYNIWLASMHRAEGDYFALLDAGATPQIARAVLPVSLKTEIVLTANPREWRWILKLRCSAAAHPDMRSLMLDVRDAFVSRWPVLFSDLEP
jgi:thymidylate synthase (FAD)